jgi:hypothetical protein
MMSIYRYSGLKTVRHEFVTIMAVNGQFYDPGAFIYRKQGRLVGLETILGSVFQEKCVKPSSLPGAFKKIKMNFGMP